MTERTTSPRRRPQKDPAEVSIEGAGLFIVAAALIAALLGSFFLGRWFERRSHPTTEIAGVERSAASPPGSVTEEPVDVAETTDFFDEVRGGGRELEPQREIPRPAAVDRSATEAGSARGAAAAPAAGGPAPGYWVQVFAGRDRRAAEGLVGKLEKEGFEVRLFREAEGQGALFKVRVGSYESPERASNAATDLRSRGYSGAWVTRAD